MQFPTQGSMGKTYLYKGFKAMMSRIVLTISAVSAYKHNKNLITRRMEKDKQDLSTNTTFFRPWPLTAVVGCDGF